jgi:hypothetical protein
MHLLTPQAAVRGLVGLVLALLVAVPALAAADRHVVIVNHTRHSLVQFYASNKDVDSWQEDILGDDTVDPGEKVRINIDDGTGHCIYDFKAVFDDGDVLIRRGINVCKVGTYTYTD